MGRPSRPGPDSGRFLPRVPLQFSCSLTPPSGAPLGQSQTPGALSARPNSATVQTPGVPPPITAGAAAARVLIRWSFSRSRKTDWRKTMAFVRLSSCLWLKPMALIKLDPKLASCFFFGDVCAHNNPKLLLSCTFGLYDYFLKELYRFNEVDNPLKSAIPLVINTSGWVKGIGLHVLSEILRYVSPTDVVQLRTRTERNNLPAGAFWLNVHEGDSPVNLVEIHAAHNPPPHLLAKKEARMIRDLRLIAYFRQCLPRDFPIFSRDDLVKGFASIQPFQLPLSKIQVIDLHYQVSGDAAYKFLVGTIVGIGLSTSVPSSTECSTPWCIGLGYIKAIDIPGDCIHLMTPVSLHHLENVDIMFRSCMAVPSCLLQVSDIVDGITDRLREL